MTNNPHGHTWFMCEMCGPSVRCGKCGNNACNAGYGTLPDGSECDACPSAYEKQNAEYAFNPLQRSSGGSEA